MVVYAEYEIPAYGFRIGRAFGQLPDVEVELERIVPTGNSVVPFIWVRGAEPGEVLRATREEQAVEEIEILNTEASGLSQYRVVWNRAFRDAVVGIAESDMALLSGRGTADAWQFELRAPERVPLSDFQEYLRTNDIPHTLSRLHELDADRSRRQDGLTESQREALRMAYHRGYFNEPRETRLERLADEVGITRQAFSGRLRRGLNTLLEMEFEDARRD